MRMGKIRCALEKLNQEFNAKHVFEKGFPIQFIFSHKMVLLHFSTESHQVSAMLSIAVWPFSLRRFSTKNMHQHTHTYTLNHSIHIHSAHPHTLPYDVKIQTMYDINLCKCTLMSYMHKYFLRLYKTWQVSILLLGCFFTTQNGNANARVHNYRK